MPRLSNRLYLEHCRFLRAAWLKFPRLYGLVSINRQWDLHAFYRPAEELTEQQRLAHRQSITLERPGLPARAGRSFKQIFERSKAEALVPQQASRLKGRDRQIRVYAVARPEPDLELLARALVRASIDASSGPTNRTS